MPFIAAMADNLSDPGVCLVSLLSSAGCTTLIVACALDLVDCALGRDNLRIAISPRIANTGQISGSTSESFSLPPIQSPGGSRLTLANMLYCTVQYTMRTLGGNLESPAIARVLQKRAA